MSASLKHAVSDLLNGTGVDLNGSAPHDLRVRDERFYARVLSGGSLALGESYMDGWWDCEAIDEMVALLLKGNIRSKIKPTFGMAKNALLAQVMNRQFGARAFHIGKAHYDIGNDLYTRMLDKRLTYTCGYWKTAMNLDDAQEAKLDLVCRKIGLQRGQRVLDIGCGWGSFAKFAAEKYGAHVVGVTVSKEQMALAQTLCKGLTVDIRLQDYRSVNETFDHIISLGMFEHVGHKNYRTYFEVARRCLKDDGLFLLHTIGGNRSSITTDPWIEKFIFPDSLIPSAAQITKAAEGLFVMEDWHNFGTDYDKTLMAWYANVEQHWVELAGKYDERFHRMWRYYLLACAATFRVRQNQLWQIVYSKNGIPGGYSSIR
ncbi:cyclopropane fatty acyl phospholipid synthase [Candidatus Uhrbacteria bacterium]|nr:cyclopropane fatty acyl phospholipid synthase [Candidatus Uhrbacteria bacterium]